MACLQFKNNLPSSASTADATTNCNIAHKEKNATFNLIGCVGLGFHPMKKCPHALLCAFAFDKYDAWSGCSISYPTREIELLRLSEWPNNQGVVCFLHPVLGAMCLLACYCAESHHLCQVDGLRIIQDASYYPLDMFYVGIQEGRGSI